ncbi:unnamed protein product [Heligmosomoides polygyrus]|uniref:HNF-1_N domain-containing protein n=1 Tax=Heligmosomoides polygyrus TaxID=6339 RepID=A0A183FLT3_HELPZ|nr:unnamed protein product [Heligmosomoides polygyrus]
MDTDDDGGHYDSGDNHDDDGADDDDLEKCTLFVHAERAFRQLEQVDNSLDVPPQPSLLTRLMNSIDAQTEAQQQQQQQQQQLQQQQSQADSPSPMLLQALQAQPPVPVTISASRPDPTLPRYENNAGGRPIRSLRTPMKEITTLDRPEELEEFMEQGEEACIADMKQFITQYSLRQTTVAMMTGVSQPYISKLLNGNHRELSLRCRKNIYCWYLNCRRHPHKL